MSDSWDEMIDARSPVSEPVALGPRRAVEDRAEGAAGASAGAGSACACGMGADCRCSSVRIGARQRTVRTPAEARRDH